MAPRRRASTGAVASEQGRLFARVCRDFCEQPPVRAWLLTRTPLAGVDATSLEQACAYVCTFRELGDARHVAAASGPPKTTTPPPRTRSGTMDAGGIDCDGRGRRHGREGRDDDQEPEWYSNDAEILVPHAVYGEFTLATVRLF
jgi:hypothetical protein